MVVTSVCVLFRYRAPELLLGSKIQTTAIDMWSVVHIELSLLSWSLLLVVVVAAGDGSSSQLRQLSSMSK